MSDFAFQIVGDASKASQSIDSVVSGLAKIPPSAQRAGAAINSAMSEAQRLTRQHEDSLRGATQRAEQLNAALQREADVLNRIRGPLRENVADMQALMALYRSGQINAHQYATEVDRLRNSIVATNQAASKRSSGFDVGGALGGLPGGSIAAGFVGGGVAGAAQAGVQTAVQGAQQVIEIADAYTGLNNRLKAMTGSQAEATALFDKLSASANKTYSNVNTTADSFIRMQRSLQGLGVSQNSVIAFTEHLNMLMTTTGTSGAGAEAALMQLSQALSSGVLRGEEFNSIIEQAPALLEPIAKHLGVTTGQLRALAQDGKITSKIIFDSFNEAGPAIERAFGDAVPTVSQQFQVLKNEAFKLVGQFAQDVELGQAVADVFGRLKQAAELAGAAMKGSAELIGLDAKALLDLKSITAGALDNFAQFGKSIDFVNAITGRSVNIQKSAEVAILASAKAANDAAEAQLKAAHATDVWASSTSTLGQVFKDVGHIIERGESAWDKLQERIKKAAAEAKKEQDEWLEYMRKAAEAEAKIRNQFPPAQDHSVTSFDMLRSGNQGPRDHSFEDASTEAERLVNAQAEAIIKTNGAAVKAQEDLAKKSAESARKMQEAYAAAAGSIAADLINAFEAGDISAEKLLRKAAILALQIAAGGVGGTGGSFLSALAGGIGGGKTGFDYTVGSSGLQLPGLQSGGSISRQPGGPEPLLAMWWMQPNETLSIRTEEQMKRSGQGSGGGGNVTVTPVIKVLQPPDRRAIVDDSRDGMTTLVRLQRQMKRGR